MVASSPDINRRLLGERFEHAREMPSDVTHTPKDAQNANGWERLLLLGKCGFNLRVDVSVWKHDSRASRLVSAVVSVGGIHCVGDSFRCNTICLVAHR